MDFTDSITTYYGSLIDTIKNLDKAEINRTMNAILEQYNRDGTIYVFGNGGSSATASHFVCDFNKGVCEKADRKFRFICLNDNIPIMMAIANDISFDEIFAFQLEGKITSDDMVIAISGSGNSKNVIKAVKKAKEVGAKVVGVTGYSGGELKKLSDYSLHVNIDDMQKTEDIHMTFDHMIMQIFSSYFNKRLMRLMPCETQSKPGSRCL